MPEPSPLLRWIGDVGSVTERRGGPGGAAAAGSSDLAAASSGVGSMVRRRLSLPYLSNGLALRHGRVHHPPALLIQDISKYTNYTDYK